MARLEFSEITTNRELIEAIVMAVGASADSSFEVQDQHGRPVELTRIARENDKVIISVRLNRTPSDAVKASADVHARP